MKHQQVRENRDNTWRV